MKKGIHSSYAPRFYSNTKQNIHTPNRLVVYQIGKLCAAVVINQSTDAYCDLDFYQTFENKVSPELKALSIALVAQKDLDPVSEENFRFLYFNSMNLALKSSLYSKSSPLSVETIKVLREMHADFQSYFLFFFVFSWKEILLILCRRSLYGRVMMGGLLEGNRHKPVENFLSCWKILNRVICL